MDHYGGKKLPYTCIKAHGVYKKLLSFEGENAGNIYEVIDASGGYGSACFGANHRKLTEAISYQLLNTSYETDELGSLAREETLEYLFGQTGLWTKRFPHGEYHVSGRNSGSEGVELALRLVLESLVDLRTMRRKKDKDTKKIILGFEGAWHGWTPGALALNNRKYFHAGLPKYLAEETSKISINFIPFGDIEALKKSFIENGEKIAAVFVEPIQGDAGIIVPPVGYLHELSNLCIKYNALLVADEVLTFAKTGDYFAMNDREEIIFTDITIIGKNLGMGVIPTSLVIAKKFLFPRSCGAVATSDLRPLIAKVIEIGIRIIEEDKLLVKARAKSRNLQKIIQEKIIDKFPEIYTEVRGKGCLLGIELTPEYSGNINKLREIMIQNGVYIEFMAGAGSRSNDNRYVFPTMRIAPPLITTEEELSLIIERIIEGSKQIKLLNR